MMTKTKKPKLNHDETIPARGDEWEDLCKAHLSQETPVAPELTQHETKQIEISEEDGELGAGNRHFNGNLLIKHYESQRVFKISNHDLQIPVMIGRSDALTGFVPIIDLSQLDEKEKTVSRRHASISPRGDVLVLTDHSSVNGTYLNAQRLVPEQGRVLRDGDMLRFGRVCLIVYFINGKQVEKAASTVQSET